MTTSATEPSSSTTARHSWLEGPGTLLSTNLPTPSIVLLADPAPVGDTLSPAAAPLVDGAGFVGTGKLLTAAVPESGDLTNKLPATAGRSQYTDEAVNTTMAPATGTTTSAGSTQAHENRQPFLALNYAIALQGYFPSARSWPAGRGLPS